LATLADIIRGIPIFSSLSREDIAKVLGKMEEISFGAAQTIVVQGDKGDAFYLIKDGTVQVLLESPSGRSEPIAVLGPQNWFGEMALLSGEPRSATIVTVKETTLWKLSIEAWDELIEKHPSWLKQFCATLSKRLARADQQYKSGRDAFNSLAEEFYSLRSPAQQAFFRRASLLGEIDTQTADQLLATSAAALLPAEIDKQQFPLIRHLGGERYELHAFFRDFLQEKLLDVEGEEGKQQLHRQIAAGYETLGRWQQAVQHYLAIQEWPGVSRVLATLDEVGLNISAPFIKDVLESIPADHFFTDLQLIHLQAMIFTQLGDLLAAIRTYKTGLARRAQGILEAEVVGRYVGMADALAQRGEHPQAINVLKSALNLVERESAGGEQADSFPNLTGALDATLSMAGGKARALLSRLLGMSLTLRQSSSRSRWLGGIAGLGVWAYLWFAQPDIGLDANGNKLLGLLSLTLIYWIFWVLPDYAVALIFGLGLILTRLASPNIVMGGFASTTWFMTLGVLGIGAAITGSGLFYRLSLHLVRFFPLSFYWQVVATGVMGVVVMALIPQQTARTSITSQMLMNLADSLGYRTPSKASTGLFAASFLGLGQLGFLFLTGSTTSLIAWGLLPADVREQFTWGYWFLAALPPTLIVIVLLLICIVTLYKPEVQPVVSYKMVQTQLAVLGPLSFKEWISLGVLCFTITGWLTASYHGIDSAWIALVAFTVLITTGVLDPQTFRRAIDWELLIYMGVTLSIPALLTRARIDQWLVELISPVILPFLQNPALFFIIIAILTYFLKLFFTSFLTVVTLCVALLPLSVDIGMSPWIVAMIILMASEVWFFPFQVDWHTLAYSTSEKKGFSYPLMCRVNPFYAVAYLLALIAAIPYWRYLGLMG
jgi:anion transporter